jgi:hypothetical protein
VLPAKALPWLSPYMRWSNVQRWVNVCCEPIIAKNFLAVNAHLLIALNNFFFCFAVQ